MDKDKMDISAKTKKSKKVQLIPVGVSLVDYARRQANRELEKEKKKL